MIQRSDEEASAQSNEAIQSALAALKRGDRIAAQRLALQAAELAPESEAPWLILAALSGPEKSVVYALKALQANPESPRARQALAWAQSRLPEKPLAAAPEEPPEPAHPEDSPADIPAPVLAESTAPPPEETIPQASPTATPEPAPAESAHPPLEAAHPTAPPQARKKASLSRSARWLIGLAVLVVVLLVAGGIYFAPDLARLLAPPAPTPQCVQPELTLGTSTFPIKSIQRTADGSVAFPIGTADTAYWVEGTTVNYVFGLAPSAGALALKASLKPGDGMTIRWADCGTDEYVVKALDPGQPDVKALLDQSVPGITVFLPGSSAGDGYAVHGVRPRAMLTTTPEPTLEGATQAQVDFGESVTSADGKTLQMSVTVTNLGSKDIALAASDISLTPEGGAALAPLSVAPALPQSIAPGAKTSFTIVFTHPMTTIAVFKLLDFTAEQYY